MQFDDVTREAIEVIQSLFRIATVRVADIFDIKINSKKAILCKKYLTK